MEMKEATVIEENPRSESTDSASISARSSTVGSLLSKHPVNIWLSLLFTDYCLLIDIYLWSVLIMKKSSLIILI